MPEPDEPSADVTPPTRQPPETRIVSARVEHQGPLPLPDLLARYDEVQPGLAARMVAMAEENHRHRIDMDRCELDLQAELVEVDAKRIPRGQWMAAGTVLGALGIAALIALVTEDGWAAASVVAAVVSAVAVVFVMDNRNR